MPRKKRIEQYEHQGKTRPNNPEVGLVDAALECHPHIAVPESEIQADGENKNLHRKTETEKGMTLMETQTESGLVSKTNGIQQAIEAH